MNTTYDIDGIKYVNGDDNQAVCNKLFFCGLTQELYSMQPTDWSELSQIIRNNKFLDIWMLLTKFNKSMYGFITQEEIRNLPLVIDMKYTYQDKNDIPKTLYSYIHDYKVNLVTRIAHVSSFTGNLRKLFITLGIDKISNLYIAEPEYIENLEAKLSQINDAVFLALYRSLTNIELQASFNEVFKNAAIGGKIRADKIRTEQNKRLNHLGSHIESMNHGEILDLLSTKQNCFNKLFELDYAYQQDEKTKTITRSKLSLQHIKKSVENQDGTYNLSSTSAGRWLIKRMPFYLWYILKDKQNYKSYCEIPWFKNYIKQFLK